MNNTVTLLIEAITKNAEKNIKKTETALQKFGRAAGQAAKDARAVGLAIGLVIGAAYAMERALTAAGQRAAELGNDKLAKSLDTVRGKLQETVDQLLMMKIGGVPAAELLAKAINLLNIPITGYQLAIETARGITAQFVIDLQRLYGITQELQGKVTEFTGDWHKLAKAEEAAATKMKLATLLSNTFVSSINAESAALEKKIRVAAKERNVVTRSLREQIAAQKELNNQFSKRWRMAEAIRGGDALALMEARQGGGSPTAGVTGSGARAGGALPSSPNKGNITVYIGAEAVDNRVRKVIYDDLMKPSIQQGTRRK